MIVKKIKNKAYQIMTFLGVDPIITYRNIVGVFSFYVKDYLHLKYQIKENNSLLKIKKINPVLTDKFSEGGIARGAYFFQDLLVAQKIYIKNPDKHLDIGSRFDGFVAHVACFRQIDVLDIRYIDNNIENISFKQADLMGDCTELYNCYDSVSSLHAIEHFGLGRYGDSIDIFGSEKGINNIYKILRSGGIFYFSVPIGSLRIEFNAHRVFSITYLLEIFKNKFFIKSFSYVDDEGVLHENIQLDSIGVKSNFGCNNGCGIFELVKI
jgi:SAM-dependent methyltransferase